MATIDVKDAAGSTVAIEKPLTPGRSAAATSRPVVLSTEDAAKVPALGQAAMAASTPVVMASNQTAIPASLESNSLYAGTTALVPKFAAISASSSGNNTLIAAVASKKIRVLSYTLVCTTAVTAKLQSGASGTDLTGAMPFGANGGVSAPFNPLGHFETAVNTLLNLSLGSAVAVAGHICYVEV